MTIDVRIEARVQAIEAGLHGVEPRTHAAFEGVEPRLHPALESIEARVHATMVPDEYPIAKVSGVYNAIQIVGDACEDIMLYGRGAGAMPTGSAVVGDIMDISRQILMEPSRKLPASPSGQRPGKNPRPSAY